MADQEELTQNVFAELESQWDKDAEANFHKNVVDGLSNIVNRYTGKTVRGLVALNIISDFYRSAESYPHILVDLDHFMISFVENLQKRNDEINNSQISTTSTISTTEQVD